MNITSFKSALSKGGARANLFEISITSITSIFEEDLSNYFANFTALCKTTAIPNSTIGSISIPFMGRDIKVAGDRTFDVLNTTIINDENFAIRNALEKWMDQIKSHTEIKQKSTAKNNINDYKKTVSLTQLSKDGTDLKEYKFINAWPSVLSEIPLDYGSGEIEEFVCTWNYDYWKSIDKSSNINSDVVPSYKTG